MDTVADVQMHNVDDTIGLQKIRNPDLALADLEEASLFASESIRSPLGRDDRLAGLIIDATY